jgi:hypothetical protein
MESIAEMYSVVYPESTLRTAEMVAMEERIPEETRVSESRITEPRISDERPAEPRTTEPRTTEPRPVDPRQPEPIAPRPIEPRPIEPRFPNPIEPRPIEPRPREIVEPRSIEPRPIEPRPIEPRTIRPREPRISEPRTPITPPRLTLSEEQKKEIQEGHPPITWKQGFVYWTINYPYQSQSDIDCTRQPPQGATFVKGVGSAYKTIQSLGGNADILLTIDLGIFDVNIEKPNSSPGKGGAIKYTKDKYQMTSHDLTVKGVRING